MPMDTMEATRREVLVRPAAGQMAPWPSPISVTGAGGAARDGLSPPAFQDLQSQLERRAMTDAKFADHVSRSPYKRSLSEIELRDHSQRSMDPMSQSGEIFDESVDVGQFSDEDRPGGDVEAAFDMETKVLLSPPAALDGDDDGRLERRPVFATRGVPVPQPDFAPNGRSGVGLSAAAAGHVAARAVSPNSGREVDLKAEAARVRATIMARSAARSGGGS